MKYALLKCDDVFEILTRAPFPPENVSANGNSESGDFVNDGVERHLACCYACRALAEALRPATGLFHESLAEEQRASLPSYLGPKRSLSVGGVAQSVRAAMGDCAAGEPSCRSGSAAPTRRFSTDSQSPKATFSSGWTLAALLVLGIVMYLNTGGGGKASFFSQTHSTAASSTSGAALHIRGSATQTLAALDLPAACRQPREALKNMAAPASNMALVGNWRCCTECHAAGKPRQVAGNGAAVHAVAVVRRESCRVCHTPKAQEKHAHNVLQQIFQETSSSSATVGAAQERGIIPLGGWRKSSWSNKYCHA